VSLTQEEVAFSLATNVGMVEYAFSLTSQYTVIVRRNTKVTLAFLASIFPCPPFICSSVSEKISFDYVFNPPLVTWGLCDPSLL
jgi:hypothetical protein